MAPRIAQSVVVHALYPHLTKDSIVLYITTMKTSYGGAHYCCLCHSVTVSHGKQCQATLPASTVKKTKNPDPSTEPATRASRLSPLPWPAKDPLLHHS